MRGLVICIGLTLPALSLANTLTTAAANNGSGGIFFDLTFQAVPTAPAVHGDLPDEAVASEIDVRGVRALDVDDLVMQALDAAIRADLRSLRVIHGRGTGALRERVAAMLRKDTRVRAFHAAAWNEGGAGVTVVEL